MTKKEKCNICGKYVKANKLSDFSLCNGSCWTNVCSSCELIVEQEILDILENNCEITGYFVGTFYSDPQVTLACFLR